MLSTRNPGDWLKSVSQVGWSKSTGALVNHDGELVGYPLRRMKPVQAAEQRGGVIIATCLEDKSSCCIHDCLDAVQLKRHGCKKQSAFSTGLSCHLSL